jgi:hypothetical protein
MSMPRKFELADRPANIALLFKFLSDHRNYNRQIQVDDIRMTFASCGSVEERAKLLLFKIFNTQSQPKLDKMKAFFFLVSHDADSLKSFASFAKFVVDYPPINSKIKETQDIFLALSNIAGWGEKTAALFLRNLALIQQTPDLRDKFWTDLNDFNMQAIRLPVDTVIQAIFSKLTVNMKVVPHPLDGFDSINDYLKECGYLPDDIIVWDDLWFWGYITQKVSKRDADEQADKPNKTSPPQRSHEWNESKYWSIFTAPKGAEHIAEIKRIAEKKFLPLLK